MDDTVKDLVEIAALGAKFALSPINPIGFIEECHRVGLLAVPAGLTSNELWDMHRRGAKLLKLFHAGQVTPPILKSILGVSPLSAMNILPSGGVSPDNANEWLDAGAAVVGMGSNLAGSDINYPFGVCTSGATGEMQKRRVVLWTVTNHQNPYCSAVPTICALVYRFGQISGCAQCLADNWP